MINTNLNPFQCANKECKKNIPQHLRNISCFKCKKYFHVKCCDTNTREFNSRKNSGNDWCCSKCRTYEKSVKCGTCNKAIPKNNLIINCFDCGKFYHSNCSNISFEKFALCDCWRCNCCTQKFLPFSTLQNENFALTMQAKDLNLGDRTNLSPSFTIQSLLDNISGFDRNVDDFIYDLTDSKYYTPSEFLSSKIPKKSFSMFHLNIASLSLHLDDLKTILSILDHPFDIIAISETKIKEDHDPISNISLDGYNFEHTPTKTDFGGVGIFIKDYIDYDIRPDLSQSLDTVSESIFIEVKPGNNKNILIGCIYRHHTAISKFTSDFFENALLKINKEKKKCALLGDFNIDLLRVDNDDKTCEFYDLITAFGFRPLILQPTRVQSTSRSTSATLIDNIFVNDIENFSTGGNITTSISDHFPQFCSISGFYTPSLTLKNSLRYGRSFKNFNNDEFKNELIKLDWENNFRHKNTDGCMGFFLNNFERLLDEMAPMKRLSNKEIGLKQRPWITNDILKLMKERDQLHKNLVNEVDPTIKNIIFAFYKKKRNHVVNIIKTSKNKFYSDFFEENRSNSKKTWEGIRDIINISRKVRTVPKQISYKGATHTDAQKMSDCFNDFFVNIGNSVEEKFRKLRHRF